MVITIDEPITKLLTHRQIIAYDHNNNVICRLSIPLKQKQIIINENPSLKSVAVEDYFHQRLIGSRGYQL